MNIRKIMLFVVIVGFNLLSCSAFAQSSVWKVSKDKNYFYLGATIHVLTESDYPLPEEFNRAYKDADNIIFETDITAAQTTEFQAKFVAAMMFKDSHTLSSELEPSTYLKLESFMESRHLPIANFSKFQPWGVSLMIAALEYQRLGFMPNLGVDNHFNDLALTDKKNTMGLETPEEQLDAIASLKLVDPNESIEFTLRDLERLPEFISLIKDNWRDGDLEALSKSSFIVQMKIEAPDIYKKLVTNRNNAWMRQLPNLIKNSQNEFVLVGAMHLCGEEGLLHQLTKQGFKVEYL